jgi:uncharacterized membrane protein YbhN (UPF0104 family)
VLVTWFILRRVGLGVGQLRGLDPLLWTPSLPALLASCLLLLGGYLASAALWGRLVLDLGGPAVATRDAIRIFMVANLGRYIPGKLWQIAGLSLLARRHGVPATTATGAAVLGQGIALAGACIVGLGALLAAPTDVRAWAVPGALALVGAVGIGLAPPVFRRVAGLWFRLRRRDTPVGLEGVHALRWLLLYTANWAVYAFSFWLLAVSFGRVGEVVPVASAFAAAYVLGYLMVFAPAGVGVREGFLVMFLGPQFGVGPAGVLAVIARLWTTVVELLPAGIFWLRATGPGAETDAASEASVE